MLAFDRKRQVHRQLQAFEHARQNRLGRRIIVVSFAAINGVGRRPDHHALRRKNLAGRELELRIVPRRLGVRVRLHPSLGERDDLIGGRDLVHEAHLLRRGRADLIALEQHLQRVRRWHEPRDALRAAGAGKEADLDLRQSDARLVRIGDDAIVASQRQFETAAHAHAVDRGGHRFAAGLKATVDERQLLRPVDEGAHCGVLAFGLGATRVFLACRLEHRQVCARREALLARGEDGAFDRLVACDLVDDLAELADDFGVDHVHRTARHVPGNERNPVGVGFETKVGQVHDKSPCRDQTRSMIVAVPMPPPMHNVISAVPLPVRSSSSSAVPRIIAPVAPSGCPIAIAPPFTLTLLSSRSNAWRKRSTTEANASLISKRSMSSIDMPERASTFFVTSTGPVSMIAGSEPMLAKARIFARGLRPAFAPASREPNSTAAAPSTMPDELPA